MPEFGNYSKENGSAEMDLMQGDIEHWIFRGKTRKSPQM
jgi:hypothetical protein